jgi:hypothetical protein
VVADRRVAEGEGEDEPSRYDAFRRCLRDSSDDLSAWVINSISGFANLRDVYF